MSFTPKKYLHITIFTNNSTNAKVVFNSSTADYTEMYRYGTNGNITSVNHLGIDTESSSNSGGEFVVIDMVNTLAKKFGQMKVTGDDNGLTWFDCFFTWGNTSELVNSIQYATGSTQNNGAELIVLGHD